MEESRPRQALIHGALRCTRSQIALKQLRLGPVADRLRRTSSCSPV